MTFEEEIGETQKSPETESRNISISDDISPRSVLEIPILGIDSDNNSSNRSNSSGDKSSIVNESLNLEGHGLQWKNLISVFKKKSRNLNRKLEGTEFGEDLHINKPSWRSFDYEELAVATDNFSSEMLIGKGGHAEVYKGCLPNGQLVAVKRITKRDKEEGRVGDFLSELGIIAHINHPNAARLLGFGVEGGLYLVLQFSPRGSLASILHGSKGLLEWGVRFKVALGVAEGLLYLHEGCHRRIIHRDIKASIILLMKDYEPQISDFGLAKWLPEKWTHHIVFPIEGTFG
ncbi:receptor-like cytosolic serine/threonine-protein kinase RBK1 [Tasmannia lanceolata]|uniref:receptor-like cytosolic serine/threonine-protein kinase RBK1 n=1 Tax=Tasmannia lanceolata TaxID=3420 RepID=UPI0040629D23